MGSPLTSRFHTLSAGKIWHPPMLATAPFAGGGPGGGELGGFGSAGFEPPVPQAARRSESSAKRRRMEVSVAVEPRSELQDLAGVPCDRGARTMLLAGPIWRRRARGLSSGSN